MNKYFKILSSVFCLLSSGCAVEIDIVKQVEITAQYDGDELYIVVEKEDEVRMDRDDQVFTSLIPFDTDATTLTFFFHNGEEVVTPKEVKVEGLIACYNTETKEFFVQIPTKDDCGESAPISDEYVILSGSNFGIATLTEQWQQWQDVNSLNAQRDVVSWRTIDIEVGSFSQAVELNREFALNSEKTVTAVYMNMQECFPDNTDRLWQYAWCQEILNNRSDYVLRTNNGLPYSFWPPMIAMNLRFDGPVVNGERYVDFIGREVRDFVTTNLKDVADEIHLDNFNYVQSWIYLNNEFAEQFSDPWEYDFAQRLGRKKIAEYLREETGLKISARASTHKFNDVLDGVVIEQGLYTPAIPGGLFEHIYQSQLICGGVAHCVLHHNHNGDFEEREREVETGRAAAIILGADFAFDRLGDQGHGDFEIISDLNLVVTDVGPVRDVEPPTFVKNSLTLADDQVFTIPAQAGDVVIAYTDVVGGTFGQSKYYGIFENEDADHKGFFWDSGLRSNTAKQDNPTLGFIGVGEVQVTRLLVYKNKPVFSRAFTYHYLGDEKLRSGVAYINTRDEPYVEGGITIPPNSGKIVLAD